MDRTKITSKLEGRFKRIEKYISSTDEKDRSYSNLFGTEPGKKLGINIDRLQEFSLKGILTVFPFEPFINALRTLYEDKRYIRFLEEAGSENGQKVLDIIKSGVIQQLENSETGQLFNETDERVFLGALTTSLYSMLDVYTKDVLSLVTSIGGASSRIVKNLSSSLKFSLKEVNRILNEPDYFYEDLVLKDAKEKGIETRLKLIKSGTGVWDCIDSATNETNLSVYEQHFKDFIKFRHIVAHENPIPVTRQFLENELIGSHVMKIKDEFNKSLSDVEAPPEMLSKLFDITMNWFNERQIPIGIIMQLTSMASIYPAIIDNSVDVVMKL